MEVATSGLRSPVLKPSLALETKIHKQGDRTEIPKGIFV